jgi:hypothetical protein
MCDKADAGGSMGVGWGFGATRGVGAIPVDGSVLSKEGTNAEAPFDPACCGDRHLAGVRSDSGWGGERPDRLHSLPAKGVVSVPSESAEADQFNQLGNEVILTKATTVAKVSVTMVSWACQTGGWSTGDCVTVGTPTFPTPVTLTLYKHSIADHLSGGGATGCPDREDHEDGQHRVSAVVGSKLPA